MNLHLLCSSSAKLSASSQSTSVQTSSLKQRTIQRYNVQLYLAWSCCRGSCGENILTALMQKCFTIEIMKLILQNNFSFSSDYKMYSLPTHKELHNSLVLLSRQ